MTPNNTPNKMSQFIFLTRWLQTPLYVGLVLVLLVYVYEFAAGLLHLVLSANSLTENEVMIKALDLIDVVMIANLLIMVIIGGYQTFVSRLNLHSHPDQPEWLDEVNAGTMKVKLALALVGISSIHLLRTFIDPGNKMNYDIMWQVVIHLTLMLSAIAIALTNWLMVQHQSKKAQAHNLNLKG